MICSSAKSLGLALSSSGVGGTAFKSRLFCFKSKAAACLTRFKLRYLPHFCTTLSSELWHRKLPIAANAVKVLLSCSLTEASLSTKALPSAGLSRHLLNPSKTSVENSPMDLGLFLMSSEVSFPESRAKPLKSKRA